MRKPSRQLNRPVLLRVPPICPRCVFSSALLCNSRLGLEIPDHYLRNVFRDLR